MARRPPHPATQARPTLPLLFLLLSLLLLPTDATSLVPIVIMHGMGVRRLQQTTHPPSSLSHSLCAFAYAFPPTQDRAEAPGMTQLNAAIAEHLNHSTPVVNIGLGHGAQDMLSSFFLTMNEQTDLFAQAVQADPRLAEGFDAISLSQGSLLIRAYIQRYNDPPVRRWISIHGPLLGVAGLPQCDMERALCDKVDALVGLGADTSFVQAHLAQANYLRDPNHLEAYLKHNIFLPYLNHEVPATAASAHYPLSLAATLEALVLVKADGDSEVYPNESEWFGYFADDSVDVVLPMRATPFYRSDAFGLRTLDQQGKVFWERTPGDHLEFDEAWLLGLIDTHFVRSSGLLEAEKEGA